MKIPAIDEGETVLPSLTRSLAVCVTLEDKHGSLFYWFSPANARKLAAQLVRAADSIRPARKRKEQP